jgi:hypothetical protein
MRKAFKFFVFAAFSFVLFLVVAATAFYHLVRIGEFRRFLISQIEQNTALTVRLGEGQLEMGRILGIAFHDVAISEPNESQPAITADRITARVALWPLFRRRVIFYEIHLEKPAARMTRDQKGKIPLLDRLLNLPFVKSNETNFGLDLRAIRVAGGEVDFQDHSQPGVPRTTYLRGIDLRLNRIRGQALNEFLQKLLQKKPKQPPGTALEFDLKTGISRDGQTSHARAEGTMVFPGDELEFDKAWWSAKTQITAMPVPMLQSLAGWPTKSLSGSLDASMQVEGTPDERLHVQGQLAFKGLTLDAPEIFSTRLQPGETRMVIDINWQPQEWDFSRFELRSNEISFALRGAVRAIANHDHYLQLSLTAPTLPIASIKKYLPTKWLASPQLDSLTAALQGGELQSTKAGVSASVSELKRMITTGFDERVSFDAELHNIGANFSGGYLPLRAVQGRIALERGVVSFKSLQGEYGQSRFTNMDGSYRFSAGGPGALQLQAQGEVDLAELRDQAKQGVLPASFTKTATFVQEIGGKGKFGVAVSRAPPSAPQVQGNLTLDGARLQFDNLSLSEIKGEVAFTPTEIKAEKMLASISGSPIQIQVVLKDYATDNAAFDLTVDSRGMKAGVVTRLLLNSGSIQDPGIVRGSIRYQGPLAHKEERKFAANLDLANVQLATRPLLQPLRELNGKIKIDDAGIDFQNVKGLLVGFPASFTGRWRYAQKPQLLFDFTAPNLDITYLLSQIDPEATDFYANLQAEGNIALAKGRIKTFDFSNFTSAVVIDRRVWRFSNPVMQSDGGSIQGVATLMDKPEAPGFSIAPKIQGVPVQSVLKWFDIKNKEITGKVNLTGHFESVGKDGIERKKNLNGAFNLNIEDGTIRRLRILVQLLNLLDLSRWFTLQVPDLNKEGIRFHRISGDFKVAKGVYSTDNLLVDSNDLRMSGAGKIDVPKDEIDFLIAVRPFAGIDTAMNYIPILGRGIAAIKNSFLVASFHITGSVEDPTIIPAPLSTVSEWFLGVLGIPKHIIGLGGDATKQEPQKEQLQENENAPTLAR